MKATIGLEIHVRLKTETKLFCSCTTEIEDAEPNTVCCPVCLGFPGSKPVVNKKAIDFAIMAAKALNCKINRKILFSRKSYFYPDMPKNYQISQYELPLATEGFFEFKDKKIGIRRIHLEEDPGRLIHVGGDITSANYVLIDYNRSGIPLLEIVTEPQLTSGKEAREFLEELSTTLQYLGIFDPNKEGSLRVDANVSLNSGERVEIKNITGFANVEIALNYEIVRQQNVLRTGGKVERETRHFDEATKKTSVLRKKEFEEDYGYIPDPDLVEIEISDEWIKSVTSRMPELPYHRAKRFVEEYGIPTNQAKVIVYVDKALADFFEECCKKYKNYKQLAKWIVVDLLKCLNWHKISISQSKVTPEGFIELLELIDKGLITERLAKEIIKKYVDTGKSPRKIVEEEKLFEIKEEDLRKIVLSVLKKNEKAVKDYKAGKEDALKFLIGQVLRESKFRGNPKMIRKILLETLR
jgi:aspartyl-tRNA(Asn)/glutamyl-tRNA(Gln) amidotransferase subunit B